MRGFVDDVWSLASFIYFPAVKSEPPPPTRSECKRHVCACVSVNMRTSLCYSQSLAVTSGARLRLSNATLEYIHTACVVTSVTYAVGGVFEIKLR